MDKVLQREQAKERMKRYRERNKVGENVTQSPDSVTESTDSVTQYHPILQALTDPVKRKKLQDICNALDRRGLQSKVYYGAGRYSLSMDVVEDLLETTG